jgi:maltooligosyltrehalose trehalohydrolase
MVGDTTRGAADVVADASGSTARLVLMEHAGRGYFECACDDVPAGSLYVFRLDGAIERPDPASRWQPHGVHGPSAVADSSFAWSDDAWSGRPLCDLVFYELHVGTFTPDGTFTAAMARLDALVELGITAIQLMPIAQFPGERNWGYDGVYPFAVQASYGGPLAFRRFVDACHSRHIAVFLDVIYNHLGPEGNYLDAYGPYFTERYRTPWGRAVNFDDAYSNEVRAFVIENALHWVRDFHVDGLRLDAIHGIFDFSAKHILEQLQDAVQDFAARARRHIQVIAESDLNDASVIRSKSEHGYGLDAQWSDDFHHALHVLLTGERNGYYGDFGELEQLATALRDGFVYTGQYSNFRRRNHGNSARGLPAGRFVSYVQNHDQIGNRVLGDRLSTHLDDDAQRLAAAVLLLAPQLPLLFMGQEYGETAPFQYFVSHSDEGLIAAVRDGRERDFASFAWSGTAPDPQAESTFARSKLDWSLRQQKRHRSLLAFHRELLKLRRRLYGSTHQDARPEVHADADADLLVIRGGSDSGGWAGVFHLRGDVARMHVPLPAGTWALLLDAADPRCGGDGGTLPQTLHSDGFVALTLKAWACAVLQRT